jgi:THO complex subunit 3
VNEFGWNFAGDLFFLTTGQGTVRVLEYPSLKPVCTIEAHTANCFVLDFDPRGRFMATGSSDAIVSLCRIELTQGTSKR